MSLGLKNAMKRALLLPGVRAPFRMLVRDRAMIFMMHRFSDPENGTPGHDPNVLRKMLAHMRKNKTPLLSLHDMFIRLRDEKPVDGAMAFTIDDGYRDQGTIGGAAFAEYDCPVTTFLTTGFIDGKIWFWWDKIELIFDQTKQVSIQTDLSGAKFDYDLTTQGARLAARLDFTARCKEVSDEDKLRGIERLAANAGVELPAKVPAKYQPLTWDEVRACEKRGMTFGPHTITHPVLARASDEQCVSEITGSWQKLKSEAASAVPVFCYPNGRWQDFGPREIKALHHAGLEGAVVGTMGYASAQKFNSAPDARFKVQRFDLPTNEIDLAQLTNGVERFKQIVRGKEV